MGSHSPGPWVVRQGDEWTNSIVTRHGQNEDGEPMYWEVASYNLRRDEAKENARLIAAAPEMLEALEGIRRECPADPDINDDWQAAWDALLAVLAKVKADQ